MFNAKLTKLRILQERAKRDLDAAEEIANQKRVQWDRLWLAYLEEAERCGLCRFCLKPLNEGVHEAADHIGVAAADDFEHIVPELFVSKF